MDIKRPTITVFGSCRVHTPCSLLQKRGLLQMKQNNIFGYIHYTKELIQQCELISGAKQAPNRLRPYLNIPYYWQSPKNKNIEIFHSDFKETDIFIVEISSIRKIIFKAFYLQINRTRELLNINETVEKNWWEPLVRHGKNHINEYVFDKATPLQAEIVQNLKAQDMTFGQILEDLKKIKHFLGKPVVFVSHFNTNYEGVPIPQRQLIVDAMQNIAREEGCRFFDPTQYVLSAGLPEAIQDLGHYRPEFEQTIAQLLHGYIEAILPPAISFG